MDQLRERDEILYHVKEAFDPANFTLDCTLHFYINTSGRQDLFSFKTFFFPLFTGVELEVRVYFFILFYFMYFSF